MEVLGFRTIAISKIRLPGGFEKRLKTDRVKGLAKSIVDHGLLHEPIVRKSDWKLVVGADRVAAHYVRGRQTITVKLVECSDTELEILQREENLMRRHDPEEQRRLTTELVAFYEKELFERSLEDPTVLKAVRGSYHSPYTAAVTKVAKLTGVNPESVKRTMKRQKKRSGPRPIPIRTFGMVLEPKFLEQVRTAHDWLSEADTQLQAAQKALTKLESSGVPFPAALLKRLHAEVHQVCAEVRSSRPDMLCPYCRGIDELQDQCDYCFRFGFITAAQSKQVPVELLDEDNPKVMVRGVLRDIGDFVAPEPKLEVEGETPWF